MTINIFFRKTCAKLGFFMPLKNVNKTNYNKNCLLSYISQPFLNKSLQETHQNIWQVTEIARIIGDYAYNVDVIDYTSEKVYLTKKYDLVFDVLARENPVYRKNLTKDSKRIIYFTGGESDFANNAELKRISDLEKRRGVRLQPRRQAPPIVKDVENYDVAIMIGNDYNFETYSKFNLKKRFKVPNTGYDFGDRFDLSKKNSMNFLYFGSAGCVHKGLDLLLEVFAEKDFPANLYVCGAFKNEKDFNQEYSEELYNTPNIKAVGFIDIWSEDFIEIASKCSFAVMPSASEARAGAIAAIMSAGLIPICSRECGYEDDEVINLRDCELETIKNTVLEYSQKPVEWIKEESERVRKIAETKYSRSEFTRLMSEAIGAAIKDE